jgi:hypothetical protein
VCCWSAFLVLPEQVEHQHRVDAVFGFRLIVHQSGGIGKNLPHDYVGPDVFFYTVIISILHSFYFACPKDSI